MAVALSTPIQTLLNQGKLIMADYSNEESTMLYLTSEYQKNVAKKLDMMLVQFKYNHVMQKSNRTIEAITDVKDSLFSIRTNIVHLKSMAKRMGKTIQSIFECQQEGNLEMSHMNKEIFGFRKLIDVFQEQIKRTQERIKQMEATLTHFGSQIRFVETQLTRIQGQRTNWIIATIFTLGLAGYWLYQNGKQIEVLEGNLKDRRDIYRVHEEHMFELQGYLHSAFTQKAVKEGEYKRREAELGKVEELINQLQPARKGTIKDRGKLMALQDAYSNVLIYVDKLHRHLNMLSLTQEPLLAQNRKNRSDTALLYLMLNNFIAIKAVEDASRNLTEIWTVTKVLPIMQATLQDDTISESTNYTMLIVN